MYAVIKTGGKQLKVSKGDFIKIERIKGDIGESVNFEEVLLVHDEKGIRVGNPFIPDVKVSGHIIEQGKNRKIIVFKKKRRKNYRRKRGHRQLFTKVMIDEIISNQKLEEIEK